MTRFKAKTLTAAVAAILALSAPASAAGLLYECDMTNTKNNRGWTSAKLAFVLPGDGSVKVIDGIIMHFLGKPLAGKILRESKTHVHVKWTLKDIRSDNGTAFSNVDYKAVVTKSSGRIRLNAKPRHFDIGLHDEGRCETRAG